PWRTNVKITPVRLILPVLFALRLFAAGHPIAPRPLVAAPYPIRTGSTAFASGRFLSAWVYDTRGAGAHIVGVFSDRDGKRISPAWFTIVTAIDPPAYLQLVATGDTYTLLWWSSATPLHIVSVDSNGAPARAVAKSNVVPLDVVALSGRERIILSEYPNLAYIDLNTNQIQPIPLKESLGPSAVASNGDTTLVLSLNPEGFSTTSHVRTIAIASNGH